MADRREPAVYTIPPHRAFADALVTGLLALHGADRLSLAKGIILVPNNRAGQAISDAFVRRAEGGLLMPRLVPIGDPELDDRTGPALDPLSKEPLPPAIDPLRRQLIFARMLQDARAMDAAEAMRLAGELGRVQDQLLVEEKGLRDLTSLDLAEGLSAHWDTALDLLKLVLEKWPDELVKRGVIDLADRRNRLLVRVEERWGRDPPPGFVVAAGVSTGAPAVARLLKRVARLSNGKVVLAGLDQHMPDAEWDAVAGKESAPPIETHPQFHLAQMLEGMSVARAEVKLWRYGSDTDAPPARSRAISNALAPARFTDKWVDLPAADRRLSGVKAIEVPTPADEAQAIALSIRAALDRPGTVALVTPDRVLARRVSAHLKRWKIDADDSAGLPLSTTPPGMLLLTLATAAADDFAPVPLLALLKHPLVTAGGDRLAWLDGARSLDRALRGPRPGAGLHGITVLLETPDKYQSDLRNAALPWWRDVAPLLEPVQAAFRASPTLPTLLEVLRNALQTLAGDGVWSGEAGRALADLFADLQAHAHEGPDRIEPDTLPRLLRQLCDAATCRPARGGHPRVFIWGLLEAKLQSAETMILGGLNEGVWPALPSPDPWLAPAVRRELKLPSLERRIGLSAHDLAGALGAPNVLLTRAQRDTSGPTNASRFWLRMETMAGHLPEPDLRVDLLARAMDGYDGLPHRAPRPNVDVPLAARPRRISVTEVDRLAADPYAFYAKAILKLKSLDNVDEEPGASWKGSVIHKVLEDWAKEDLYAEGALIQRMRHALDGDAVSAVVRTLWLPRLVEVAEWIEAQVEANRADGRTPMAAEVDGTIDLDGVTLHGRADRIDRTPGGVAIIDYKTGKAPSPKQVNAGLAVQLGLLGKIAEEGGFDKIGQLPAEAFEYWTFQKDGDAFGKMQTPTGKGDERIAAEAFVETIAGKFKVHAARWLTGDEAFKAKLHPDYTYSEYDQLMRLEEWQGRE